LLTTTVLIQKIRTPASLHEPAHSNPMNKILGDGEGAEMGLLSHLIELRDRLLRMLLAVGIFFLILFPFSGTIWTYLSEPLTRHAGTMQAIDIASPFLIPFKVCLLLSVILSAPVLLYQIWAFVAPGLYKHEKRLVTPLLVSSTVLFYLGMAFAYFVVFPLVFGFFSRVAPEGVEVVPDIGRYLDFIITIFIADLIKKRPYFIVCAFVIGMFLTPPDVISQTLLAVPMWLLYEVGIFFSRIFLKRKEEFADAADAKYNEEPDITSEDEAAADELNSSDTPK